MEDFDAIDSITDDSATGQAPTTPNASEKPPVDEKVKNFITQWTKRIKASKKHHEPAFKQMDECMQLAKDGASAAWASNKDNYTVPILNRLNNQAVAQLYARHPETLATRKKRRMFTVWDGQLATLNDAEGVMKMAMTSIPPQVPDPHSAAIVQDANNVKAYNTLMDGIADTLTKLHDHYMDEQSAQYKSQFKALVRRTKVVGVGYVKLCFQRILEKNPDITVKIAETTEQIATLRALIAQAADGDIEADSAQAEQLETLQRDLQTQETLIVSEGPLYAFPKPKSIIIDKACQQLKTLAGAGWLAEEFEKTSDEILEDYQVDIAGNFTTYKASLTESAWERFNEETGEGATDAMAKVWRVQNRKTGQEFTICEGYDDFLKPPGPPDIKIARFFDIFPLVFNEVESEKDLYPPSDIWNARHMQNEYNRTRQFLREHRLQNRPAYITGMGMLEEKDLDKLQNHASGAILVLNQIGLDDDIRKKLMSKPVMVIDPKQYEVDSIWQDILRVTGDQQADAGPTTTATATESSIAEQGRTVGLSDSVDDIDDMLSLLVQATGQLMLKELSKQTVMEIVGPGAVWPEVQESREDICEEITLDIRAGSSGRPNKAIDLQNLQTAMPLITQLPGANPTPILQKVLDTLDIDAEDMIVDGLPSIAAINAIASHPPPPPGAAPPQAGAPPPPHPPMMPPQGPPNAPNMQGPQGIHNAPRPPGVTPPPHAMPPAPVPLGHMANGAPGGVPAPTRPVA